MKSRIIIFLLMLSGLAIAQPIDQAGSAKRVTKNLGGVMVDSVFTPPFRNSHTLIYPTMRSEGRVQYNPAIKTLEVYNGTRWMVLGTLSLSLNKEEYYFTYTGSNNTRTLNNPTYNANHFVYINGLLLSSLKAEYTIVGNLLTINPSLLTSGINYNVVAAYPVPIYDTNGYIDNLRRVATHAAMDAQLPYDDPASVIYYEVKADEQQGGYPTYYSHYNNQTYLFIQN